MDSGHAGLPKQHKRAAHKTPVPTQQSAKYKAKKAASNTRKLQML
jgi:hypothetical protein